MRLESFGVCGFKSLADVSMIPVRQPTIITGENDGGKSSALEALAFLLGERIPTPEDYTRKQDAPVSTFRAREARPGWVPSRPRGGGAHPATSESLAGTCRFSAASPSPLSSTHRRGST